MRTKRSDEIFNAMIEGRPSTAQYLAESLKNGLHFEPQQNRQSIKDLLDLAIFYLRISVASMV